MTNSSDNKTLTNRKLSQLIALAKQTPAEKPDIETSDYDFTIPHRFMPAQQQTLEDIAKTLHSLIAQSLSSSCNQTFEPAEMTVSHDFTHKVTAAFAESQNTYLLSLKDEHDVTCAYISLPIETSSLVIGYMLCDPTASPQPERKLSTLEESVLAEAIFAIADALTEQLAKTNIPALTKNIGFSIDTCPIEAEPTDDLTTFGFETKTANKSANINFIIKSALLSAAVGAKSKTISMSEHQTREAILENVSKMPVKLTAQLASGPMSLDDVLNLSVGDIVVLDKKIFEPLDLLVNNRAGFYGYPASSGGKCAVVITPKIKKKIN